VKLQTYTPETITLDSDSSQFTVAADHPLWAGRTLHDLYSEAHTPWEWHEPIFSLATSLGLEVFSTPFDESAVDFLEELGVTRFKIASLEIVDIPLIVRVAATLKPIILSTGASNLGEIDEAVDAVLGTNPKAVVTLLLCSSSYPANPGSIGLRNMGLLRQRYGTRVGYSDHTEGLGVAVAAAALGAQMIEKHMTSNDRQGGPDESFSASEHEMGLLVRSVRDAVHANQEIEFGPTADEAESRRLRPSLWVTVPVSQGDLVTASNVSSLRPGGGLAPGELTRILGKRFVQDTGAATPVTEDLLAD